MRPAAGMAALGLTGLPLPRARTPRAAWPRSGAHGRTAVGALSAGCRPSCRPSVRNLVPRAHTRRGFRQRDPRRTGCRQKARPMCTRGTGFLTETHSHQHVSPVSSAPTPLHRWESRPACTHGTGFQTWSGPNVPPSWCHAAAKPPVQRALSGEPPCRRPPDRQPDVPLPRRSEGHRWAEKGRAPSATTPSPLPGSLGTIRPWRQSPDVSGLGRRLPVDPGMPSRLPR